MAVEIIVEDGTGLNNANSYAGVDVAGQYFENTGRKDTWSTYSAAQRQAALIAAAQYMDEVYGHRYLGDLPDATRDTQGLLWPRKSVPNPRAPSEYLADPAFPAEIGLASAEFALALLVDGGGTLFGQNDGGGPTVVEKSVRVEGAVSKSERFAGGGTPARRRRFPQAESVLRSYITASQARVLRA